MGFLNVVLTSVVVVPKDFCSTNFGHIRTCYNIKDYTKK